MTPRNASRDRMNIPILQGKSGSTPPPRFLTWFPTRLMPRPGRVFLVTYPGDRIRTNLFLEVIYQMHYHPGGYPNWVNISSFSFGALASHRFEVHQHRMQQDLSEHVDLLCL